MVEVSLTALQSAREKQRLYARAGIPAYWIVNLVDRQVEVLTSPVVPDDAAQDPHYAKQQIAKQGDQISLSILAEPLGQVDVAELLV